MVLAPGENGCYRCGGVTGPKGPARASEVYVQNRKELFGGSDKMTRFIPHLPWFVGLGLFAMLCEPAFAVTLTWVGDAGTGWFDNVAGNTNWYDSTNSIDNAVLTAGDDVVFLGPSTGAIYGGALSLGNTTIALNSITVGAPGDTAPGQASDFAPLVSPPTTFIQTLATNGIIQLGAGGLTMHMAAGPGTVYNDPIGNYRHIRFETAFELLGPAAYFKTVLPSSTMPYAKWKERKLQLARPIQNAAGVPSVALESLSPDGGSSTMFAVVFEQGMANFVGTLSLSGAQDFKDADLIWGDASNLVKMSVDGTQPAYLFKSESGNKVAPNNLQFGTSRSVLLNNSASGSWTFTGDISGGGSSYALDLLGAQRTFVFAGEEQNFLNYVSARCGVNIIVSNAGPSGEVWPSANYVRLNGSDNYTRTTPGGIQLQGDLTLKKRVEVRNINPGLVTRVKIGEVNGAQAYNARFTGQIDVLEPDYQALMLTADAGGSAIFDGPIRIVGGTYGFDKIGAGTVAVNNRVSQSVTDTNPIGTVNVQEGTLLVNSPLADAFYTTGIVVDDGAALGGVGNIVGDVTLSGASAATLAPGGDAGPLVVSGDVDFDNAGVLAVTFGANADNRLDVGGLLDLSAGDSQLLLTSAFPGNVGLVASYGALEGTFNSIDLSVLGPGWWVEYNYLGQNQIAIVPEPAALLLLLAGVFALLPARSRRRPL